MEFIFVNSYSLNKIPPAKSEAHEIHKFSKTVSLYLNRTNSQIS